METIFGLFVKGYPKSKMGFDAALIPIQNKGKRASYFSI